MRAPGRRGYPLVHWRRWGRSRICADPRKRDRYEPPVLYRVKPAPTAPQKATRQPNLPSDVRGTVLTSDQPALGAALARGRGRRNSVRSSAYPRPLTARRGRSTHRPLEVDTAVASPVRERSKSRSACVRIRSCCQPSTAAHAGSLSVEAMADGSAVASGRLGHSQAVRRLWALRGWSGLRPPPALCSLRSLAGVPLSETPGW